LSARYPCKVTFSLSDDVYEDPRPHDLSHVAHILYFLYFPEGTNGSSPPLQSSKGYWSHCFSSAVDYWSRCSTPQFPQRSLSKESPRAETRPKGWALSYERGTPASPYSSQSGGKWGCGAQTWRIWVYTPVQDDRSAFTRGCIPRNKGSRALNKAYSFKARVFQLTLGKR